MNAFLFLLYLAQPENMVSIIFCCR